MTLRKNGDTSALPAYVPLKQAARLSGLSLSVLQARIRAGTIRAITINGEIAVRKRDINGNEPTLKELADREAYINKYFAHLKGKGVSQSEAAAKYHIPQRTISRWMERGYIKHLGIEGNKVLIDEADVAYCAEVYKLHGGQGRRVFSTGGTPYIPKGEGAKAAIAA